MLFVDHKRKSSLSLARAIKEKGTRLVMSVSFTTNTVFESQANQVFNYVEKCSKLLFACSSNCSLSTKQNYYGDWETNKSKW